MRLDGATRPTEGSATTTILTDDECREIYNDAMAMPERSVVQTMRVIEAAVLTKLGAGYPCVLLKDGPTYTLDSEQPKEILNSVSKAAYAAGVAAYADNAKLSGAEGVRS